MCAKTVFFVLALASGAVCAEHPLAQLQFRNSGVVRRDMQFRYFDQPVAYVEDLERWNVQGISMYLYQLEGGKKIDPPVGMRSAVPLGGLGSGTVELRADGSFRDWNIFNNSPAGGTKIQRDEALFGIRIRPPDCRPLPRSNTRAPSPFRACASRTRRCRSGPTFTLTANSNRGTQTPRQRPRRFSPSWCGIPHRRPLRPLYSS